MQSQPYESNKTPSGGIQIPGGIFIPEGLPYDKNFGAIFQAMLNRAKTPAPEFAGQTGHDMEYVNDVIQGRKCPTPELLATIERISPLNARELIDPRYRHKVPVFDDSTDGVIVCREKDTKDSLRETHRGHNELYYSYFHTATQKKSPIIPELIIEHHEHDPKDPNLDDTYFNRGHRERQMTIVLGNVNYHWKDQDGKPHIIPATTGDANVISSYTWHSFSVPPGKKGAILAITDMGPIRRDDFQAMIQSIDLQDYLEFMKKTLPDLEGENTSFDKLGGFMFRKHADAEIIDGPKYLQRVLMDGVTFQPHLKTIEYTVKARDGDELDITRGAYRWGYVHGDVPILLRWGTHEEKLEPGASFSIQKNIPHAFRIVDGNLEAKLAVMESNPDLENPLLQLALIDRFTEDGVQRVHTEKGLWYVDGRAA
tara:strand:+ start:180 stop:1457 length:1278 start_codon:yes stop_codon:yes gene_type:complete